MNKLKFAGLVAGICWCSTQASAAGGYAFQTDLENLREDVEVLQRQIYRDKGNLTAGKSSDVLVRMSTLEEQMRQMNGKFEEIDYKLRQISERIDVVNKDIDVRIKMIEGKPIKGGIGTKSHGAKFEAPKAQHAPKSLIGDSIQGGDLAPLHGQDVNSIYQEGLEAFNDKNLSKAEEKFNLVLDKFPQEKLASNAQYWLGEVYYTKKNYAKAAVLFGKGYERYKDGAKGAESLYKLGMSMKSLDKKDEACTAFLSVGKEFPKANSSLIAKARAEADKLKCK